MSYDKLSRDELLKIVKDCKEEKPKRKRVSKVEEDIIDTPKPSVVSLSKLSDRAISQFEEVRKPVYKPFSPSLMMLDKPPSKSVMKPVEEVKSTEKPKIEIPTEKPVVDMKEKMAKLREARKAKLQVQEQPGVSLRPEQMKSEKQEKAAIKRLDKKLMKEIEDKGVTTIEKKGDEIKIETEKKLVHKNIKYTIDELKSIVASIRCPKVDMKKVQKYKQINALLKYLESVNCPVLKIIDNE
jgi:hypothetical protein